MAKAITESLGVMLDPIPSHITENTTRPTPFMAIGMREGLAVTPIEPGNKQIEASITAEYSYNR